MNSLPANCCGRCSGVALRKSQIPCRSGWPSAVRGGVHGFLACPKSADWVTSRAATARTVRRMRHPLLLQCLGQNPALRIAFERHADQLPDGRRKLVDADALIVAPRL